MWRGWLARWGRRGGNKERWKWKSRYLVLYIRGDRLFRLGSSVGGEAARRNIEAVAMVQDPIHVGACSCFYPSSRSDILHEYLGLLVQLLIFLLPLLDLDLEIDYHPTLLLVVSLPPLFSVLVLRLGFIGLLLLFGKLNSELLDLFL